MWVRLNVCSPFDQDVSLPNVTAAVRRGGGGGPLDLGIKATSVYLRFEKKKKSLYSREEWHTVMMLTQVCTLATQRQAGWRRCMFYFKGCRDKQSDRGGCWEINSTGAVTVNV